MKYRIRYAGAFTAFLAIALAACGSSPAANTPTPGASTPSAVSSEAALPSTSSTPNPAEATPTPGSTPAVDLAGTGAFTVTKLSNGNTEVGNRTWFPAPVKLSGTFTLIQGLPADSLTVWQVGAISDGTDIDYAVNTAGLGPEDNLFLDDAGALTVLSNYGGFCPCGSNADPLANGVSVSNITYPELSPAGLEVGGKGYANVSGVDASAYGNGNPTVLKPGTSTQQGTKETTTKIGSTKYGTLYEVTQKAFILSSTSQLLDVQYVLAGYAFFAQEYLPSPAYTSIAPGRISYNGGSMNGAAYGNGGGGCSQVSTSGEELVSPSKYALTKEGSVDGHALYEATSSGKTPAFETTMYSLYHQNGGTASMATFLGDHPVLFFKGTNGGYFAVFDTDYVAIGGCGKPVLYLYPTKTTAVNVGIDADVKVSDPSYGSGWNVVAHPSGSLSDRGKTYGSLYWEGYSLHDFPAVDAGTMVPHAEAAQVLAAQASELGLDSAERAQFLAFWVPRIPDAPYVEVSWLTTAQLNRIIPLSIVPAPTTLIRVFVIMRGSSSDEKVAPEWLPGPPSRNGFTVVEWGGLLSGPVRGV